MTDFDYPAFLAARLDEVEALARATAPPPWTHEYGRHGSVVADAHGETVADPGYRHSDRTHLDNARHIAYHDPAYVLADIAAKRTTLEQWNNAAEDVENWPDNRGFALRLHTLNFTIKHLCRPFADHPDYQGER